MKKIIERVKQITFKTRDTWSIIKEEESTVSGLFRDYLLILAAFPALAKFLGRLIVGYKIPFTNTIRLSFTQSLITAVVEYFLILLGVWTLAKIIYFFSPKFSSVQDEVKSFKISLYSFTPYIAAGILLILPKLDILLPFIALYCLIVLYIGLPIVIDVPKEKSLPFTILIIIAMVLILFLIHTISGVMLHIFGPEVFIS